MHGPLTVILMLEVLMRHVQRREAANGRLWAPEERIQAMSYRNVAPLFAGEEMRICARKKDEDCTWETWIEGPDGGLAVRATVEMTQDNVEADGRKHQASKASIRTDEQLQDDRTRLSERRQPDPQISSPLEPQAYRLSASA